MSERKGNISVNTSDIFPIIKKWLYSEHDIFLRELIANSCDAITKRSTLGRVKNQEIPEGRIEIDVNKEAKTVVIKDNGLGMTEAEVEKYIAQLAFSGAEEFAEKMKKENAETADIIGKFGLGFFSVFMVADKVELETLSMDEGSTPTKWICAGETDYTFESSTRSEVGTTITLHISEEGTEFLDEYKVKETVRNHCDFMPYPIYIENPEAKAKQAEEAEKNKKEGDEEIAEVVATPINDTKPLWKQDPTTLKDEDYLDFFKKQFPMEAEPLFWIHLRVDHPFTLEGILYFPKLNMSKPFNESNIRLYCRQVFVSDNVKNVIPEFLSLLRGTLDSTDIPLNVSRSSLQGDPNIKKISNYIIKKVAESLKKLFKNDRERFETIWENIGLFTKYGIISDTKFDDLMRDMIIFKNSEDKYTTLSEYAENVPEEYKEKMKGKVIYFEKGKSDIGLRKQLLGEGVQCIITDDHIDPHLMQHVEMHKKGDKEYKFSAVDSELENILTSENATDEDMKIKDYFQKVLIGKTAEELEAEAKENPMGGGLGIEVKKIKNASSAAYYKVDEQMKRFQQMTQSMGQNATFPVKKTLVINPANQLIQNAYKISETGTGEELAKKICFYVQDLAAISSEGLKDEEMDLFVQRSQELMQELTEKVTG